MTFEEAVHFVLVHEGGYSFDPSDPGGETNFGISKKNYPQEDIKNMTEDRAKAIYQRDFWSKLSCDLLPDRARLMVFDAAVNQGLPTAAKMLQQVVGATVDGAIGPHTIQMAAKEDPTELVLDLARARVAKYMEATMGFQRFGKGWVDRVFNALDSCLVYKE